MRLIKFLSIIALLNRKYNYMKKGIGRSLKPEIDVSKLGKNPFIDDLVITVNKLALADKYTADKVRLDDGSLDVIYTPAYANAESDDMVKMYCCATNRKELGGLSSRAKELYLFMAYCVDYNEDWIWVNRAMYMKENSISAPNTYLNARNELVDKKVIQVTIKKDVFHINPKYFFKGNRINKYGKQVKFKL